VLRFWLDHGVDGFRVDVAHGLVKEEGLRDQVVPKGQTADGVPLESAQHAAVDPAQHSMIERTDRDEPMWDQPEIHDIYRRWHKVLADYPGDRMTVAEAWTQTPESMARFVREDEMSQAFNFAWLLAPWSAAAFERVITASLEALEDVHAAPTWVLSNHDVVRHPTRYGGGQVGLARARAATLAMLALPGSAYLYQGEELGLEQADVPPEHRQDPHWVRTGEIGRDGSRVPLPWSGARPPFGFGPGTQQPWLPQPEDWAALTVEAQELDPGSTLHFYRAALAVRRQHKPDLPDDVEVLDAGPDVLALTRGPLTVVLNAGADADELPRGEVVLSSGELEGRLLPADTAVWLRSDR
jgi:alpha-glucosidase